MSKFGVNVKLSPCVVRLCDFVEHGAATFYVAGDSVDGTSDGGGVSQPEPPPPMIKASPGGSPGKSPGQSRKKRRASVGGSSKEPGTPPPPSDHSSVVAGAEPMSPMSPLQRPRCPLELTTFCVKQTTRDPKGTQKHPEIKAQTCSRKSYILRFSLGLPQVR